MAAAPDGRKDGEDTMLRSILVGLDGSKHSATATDLAIKWARQFQPRLVGIGVVDEPGIHAPESVPVGGAMFEQQRNEQRMTEARERVREILAKFADRCEQVGVEYDALETVGEPCAQILLAAQSRDVVILGTESHYHFETSVAPGETVEKVLKSSPRPVVAVPAETQSGAGIIVAYDGRPGAARSLQALVALGLATNRHVHIVTVDRKSADAAQRTLDPALQYLRSHEIEVATRPLVTDEKIEVVLLNESERLKTELLVMGAYGQSRLSEFLLGSTTRHMLASTRIPLLLSH
jgi:nucleotide-binding universal stress UspA family protein